MSVFYTVESISELHRFFGIDPPKHPAISVINFSEMRVQEQIEFKGASTSFFIISLKSFDGSMKYGRNYYDFEEGTLTFTGPNQIMYPSHLQSDLTTMDGWSLIFHPDIFYGTTLANKIDDYTFFSYESDEALHLSIDERKKIKECVSNIIEEYSQNMDNHSQELIISNLELLLNYCKRFYDRQFLTRKKHNTSVVSEIEKLLKNYFDSDEPLAHGLPTVKYCADHVNLSPNYLSDLLKKETGKNTKEHIDYYLLNKAKSQLLGTNMNINEIAYALGFEDPKSFSKFFKKKNRTDSQ